MRKIISLYQRNYDGDRLVRDEVVPGAEWVLRTEDAMTRTPRKTKTWALVAPGGLICHREIRLTRRDVQDSLYDWPDYLRAGYRIEKVTIVPGWTTTPKKRRTR